MISFDLVTGSRRRPVQLPRRSLSQAAASPGLPRLNRPPTAPLDGVKSQDGRTKRGV